MPTPTATAAASAEVRAEMGRQGLSVSGLAQAGGFSTVQLSRRLNGRVAWTVDDLSEIADALDVPLSQLLPDVTDRTSVEKVKA